MWTLALAGARAHRAALTGTALTLAAAGAVLSTVGVLAESGLRGGADIDGGTLTTLAASYTGTALVVVVLVVAATVTLALRGRRREFALLRTVGATRRQIRQQVSREVVLVALLAVPLGAIPGVVVATRLEPLLREAGVLGSGSALRLSPLPAVAAVVVLLPSALLAGRLAARETVRTAATDALRASAAEDAAIGPTRRLLALVTAVAGVAAAFAPLVVPGTIGGTSAATSAFLLVGATALAGPLLVGQAFARTERLTGGRRPAPTRLALHNLRGFSRRLTTVVAPLALALATGTVQTSVDGAVAEAGRQQLRAALTADLVVTGAALPGRLADLIALRGVTGVVPLADRRIQVRTDDDDLPDSLAWETTGVRVVPADASRTLFDPGVTRGALTGLAKAGTVAISSDAAFELGRGLGDTVEVRDAGTDRRLRVVAVFDRGLGVGDYLIGPATAEPVGGTPAATVALVSTSQPPAATAERLRALGLTVGTPEAYVATVIDSDAALQHLSTVLLLLLLVFVGLGAANSLVLTTAGRRAELALLHRTGTTRRQLLRMTMVESLLTGALAWLVGTVAVLPAVLGVSLGLLGWQPPAVDLTTYVLLSGAVLLTAVGATGLTAWWAIRRVGGSARR
ncbi:ABC transporter permease [Nocardioides sp. CER19]|uniref:ABC transporter permease n=1 Tax=Nocardioides sp. CER19 TaxID=3038538 RepID=UPI00244A21E1|nr:ABC transporter permease [Nocardioides sp. CER19]MDH2415968.1 ABC transporter permease [Nocardioides sp. CER19]